MYAEDWYEARRYGFASVDDYDDAKREAMDDAFLEDPYTVRCEDCGELWNQGYIPASYDSPADIAQAECPGCGGQPERSE